MSQTPGSAATSSMSAATLDAAGGGGQRYLDGIVAMLQLSRPFTLLAPAVGMVAGGFVALQSASGALRYPAGHNLWPIIWGAVAAALGNAASNAINQIYDLDIDRIAKPGRPLPSGRVTVAETWVFTVAAYAAAIGAAILASRGNAETLVLFGIAFAATVIYSVPPFRTKARGWLANITIAIPRGFLLFVAGWSVTASIWTREPWLLGAVPGLYLLGAASTKDFADMAGDRVGGIKSLPIMYGQTACIRLIAPFLVMPFLLLAALAVMQLAGMVPTAFSMPPLLILLLALAMATWSGAVTLSLLRDPGALTSTENHPAWRHMYLTLVAYYVGLMVSSAAALNS